MSRGFILSIYQLERDSTQTDIEHANQSLKRKLESQVFGNNVEEIPDYIYTSFMEKDLPDNFIDYNEDIEYKLLDKQNAKVYRKLLDFSFNSLFCKFRDKLGVDIYHIPLEYIKLESSEIDKIIVAIDYLLTEKYDRKMEFVLDNSYIDALGDLYSPYLLKNNDDYDFEDQCYTEEVKEQRCALERLKTALNAYRYADEDDIILIATGW